MAKTKKENFKTYNIRTFEDFASVVKKENVDMLCANFYGSMLQLIDIKSKAPGVKYLGFNWIDDGKIEVLKPKITIELADHADVLRDELELLALSEISNRNTHHLQSNNKNMEIAQSIVNELLKNYNVTPKMK